MIRNRVRQLREAHRISRKRLAEATGLGESTILRMELGRTTRYDAHVLEALAGYFNVGIEALLEIVPDLDEEQSPAAETPRPYDEIVTIHGYHAPDYITRWVGLIRKSGTPAKVVMRGEPSPHQRAYHVMDEEGTGVLVLIDEHLVSERNRDSGAATSRTPE